MILVIMAAGMGSRFGGLKQLEPIDEFGNFLIDYSVFDSISAGFNEVVFIIRKENFKAFSESIGKRIEKHIKTTYIFQENYFLEDKYEIIKKREKPLGTGYAIYLLKDLIKENFAVINADDFYGRESFFILAKFLKQDKINNFGLVAFNLANTLSPNGAVKRGICNEKNNKLIDITECRVNIENNVIEAENLKNKEKLKIDSQSPVSMNMFALTPKVFEILNDDLKEFLNNKNTNLLSDEFFLPTSISGGIKNNVCNVEILKTPSKWLGLTYKDDLSFVKNEIKKLCGAGEYPAKLWKTI